jgi:flagellar hook-basal body complex protein FliE
MNFTVSDKEFISFSRKLLACQKAQSAAESFISALTADCSEISARLEKTHNALATMVTGGPGHVTDDQSEYLQACMCVEENKAVMHGIMSRWGNKG